MYYRSQPDNLLPLAAQTPDPSNMNIRRKLRAHTEVHTGPLNDILFILLLFFLIASTLANPNLVKVNNPKGSKDMKAKQNIVVSVNKEHQYFMETRMKSSSITLITVPNFASFQLSRIRY